MLVAGISNEAFSSTLRAIPVLFSTVDRGTGEKNDHGAHGKYGTRAPVRAFVPYKVGGESLLRAAYRCTPRVQFARDDLKPGAKITGKTLAEFANGHHPLDIIVYAKDEKTFGTWPTTRAASSKLPANRSPVRRRSPRKSPKTRG